MTRYFTLVTLACCLLNCDCLSQKIPFRAELIHDLTNQPEQDFVGGYHKDEFFSLQPFNGKILFGTHLAVTQNTERSDINIYSPADKTTLKYYTTSESNHSGRMVFTYDNNVYLFTSGVCCISPSFNISKVLGSGSTSGVFSEVRFTNARQVDSMLYVQYDYNFTRLLRINLTNAATEDIGGSVQYFQRLLSNEVIYFTNRSGLISAWSTDSLYVRIDDSTRRIYNQPVMLRGLSKKSLIFSKVTNENELWVYNPDTDQQTFLHEFDSLEYFFSSQQYRKLQTTLGEDLYFAADDGVHGVELWKTDGTVDGTVLVDDIYPGEPGSNINFIFSQPDKLIAFTAEMNSSGEELWLIPADTHIPIFVGHINLGPESPEILFYDDRSKIVLFAANSDEYGRELWGYNILSNSLMLFDFAPGPASSNPTRAMIMDDIIYLVAKDLTTETGLFSILFGIVTDAEDNFGDLVIYPNPTTDFVTLKKSNENLLNVKIFDSLGRLLHQIDFPQGNNDDMSINLPSKGVYVVVISNSTSTKTKKIIRH